MTLWILFCKLTKDVDTLFTFYARDRDHAEQQATKILDEHPYERIELKESPFGFVMMRAYMPGRLEEERPIRW